MLQLHIGLTHYATGELYKGTFTTVKYLPVYIPDLAKYLFECFSVRQLIKRKSLLILKIIGYPCLNCGGTEYPKGILFLGKVRRSCCCITK